MLAKPVPSPAVSASAAGRVNLAVPPKVLPLLVVERTPRFVSVRASVDAVVSENSALTGIVFRPFEEVQDQLQLVAPSSGIQSLARQRYSAACEAAVNEQINVEYNASYVYHTLFAYFDRDNVALPGFAQFFKNASDEEREHAESLMKYQNTRGGKVKLQSILMPSLTEFDDSEKGDALSAMELALALERLVHEKLLKLHKVASEEDDPQLQDYVEGEFLKSQVEDIKKVASYVSQLRRVGKGHGVYHFDLKLQNGAA
ncbi:hypothetical protein KP509_28G051800 [Ceratopteris richardii]|uniref:Ferritin n=1 Tax=Ceratopteris richardii TaxID=49495 RepID=A0A8T2RDS2_CERRI|nr:hypothetical protein KP509_28G051800 [Ceratopteris richardii]